MKSIYGLGYAIRKVMYGNTRLTCCRRTSCLRIRYRKPKHYSSPN